MYGCDLLFSPETAEQVRAVVRERCGGCRCESGGWCPLLPVDIGPLLEKVLPIPAVEEPPAA